MAVDQQKVERWFTHHAPRPDQIEAYRKIRLAGKQFALMILEHTPPCADQSASIRHIRDAVADANAAIACGGM